LRRVSRLVALVGFPRGRPAHKTEA
jgi:hypothetical protein